MNPKRMDVSIEIAGGLLWVAPRSLGGHSPKKFSEIWMGSDTESVPDLIRRSAMMPLTLYQDDGYNVRLVDGELSEQEREEWTAHACMNLQIPCGELLISGVLTPDFENLEFPEMELAKPNSSSQFGCYVKVDPGTYRIDVYSYPPGDLSAAWGHIVDKRTFGKHPALQSEDGEKYFKRTRPGLEVPAWILLEDDETRFVNFIIQISPEDLSLAPPELSEDGFGIAWEFRKPEKCPLGIVSELDPDD